MFRTLRRAAPSLAAAVLASPFLQAQTAPAAELVLEVGTLHPISGEAQADGILVIGGGRILAAGRRGAVALPDGVATLRYPDGHAYPGLIDAWTTAFVDPALLGGGEADAGLEIAGGLDAADPAGLELAAGGVTTAQVVAPSEGRFAGQTALIRPRPDGFAAFGAAAKAAVHLRLTTPAGQHVLVRQRELAEAIRAFDDLDLYQRQFERHAEAMAKYETKWREYLEALKKAKDAGGAETGGGETGGGDEAGGPARPRPPREPRQDPSKDALAKVLAGSLRLSLEAWRKDEVRAALALLDEHHPPHVTLAGAAMAEPLAAEIAARGVAVVLAPRIPPRELDGERPAAGLAAALHRAGVALVVASADGRHGRFLPLLAAACAGEGVPTAAAERAITLTAAEALGIAAEVGSLDPGKRADVIVTSGPLLASGSRILRVLADGKTIHQAR